MIKADVKAQLAFEELYNKNQVIPRLKKEFMIPEIIAQLTNKEIPEKFGISLLIQMVLHKRASASILIGILHHHFEKEENPLQACADMLVTAAKADLVDWDSFSEVFILRIDVTGDVYEDLERYQYPLPMLIEPKWINTNKESGYLTHNRSVILKDNHHDDDVCLDHINQINRTKLAINIDTVRMVQNEWANLDKQKPGEAFGDFKARKKAFEKYDRSSRDVIDHLLMWGNEFYLTNRYDKRGRSYAQGYHVNPQGNAWNKAVVEFSNQEVTQI